MYNYIGVFFNDVAGKLDVRKFTIELIEEIYQKAENIELVIEWGRILKWAGEAKSSDILVTENYIFTCVKVE